jgi:hypothetical protein
MTNNSPINRNLIIAGICLGLYALVLAVFDFSTPGADDYVSYNNPEMDNGYFYTLILTAIDHQQNQIHFELKANAPKGRGQLLTCAVFGYELDQVDGYTAGFPTSNLRLTEKNRAELPSEQRPSGADWTVYEGEGQFPFMTDLKTFPFDTIHSAVSFSADCTIPADAIPAENIFVQSHLSDYVLYAAEKDNGALSNSFQFELRRNGFLVFLTWLIFGIAFLSAIVIVGQRGTDLSGRLLAYFLGLWAIRGIILDPIQDTKPFPTYIEITIIYLFCFTVLGVFILNRQSAAKANPQDDAAE